MFVDVKSSCTVNIPPGSNVFGLDNKIKVPHLCPCAFSIGIRLTNDDDGGGGGLLFVSNGSRYCLVGDTK